MEFDQIPPVLRVFRFIGRTQRFEDNVTRALLCVITRSMSGNVILRRLLELICERLEDSGRPQDVAIAAEMRREIPRITKAKVSTQKAFEEAERASKSDFAIVVELGPSLPPPQINGRDYEPEAGGGRLDAALEIVCGDNKSFDVAIESKLYSLETGEKLAKYAVHLNAERHAITHLKWEDVLALFDELPKLNRSEALIEDFVEYLESFYWLAGFRGFAPQHFTEDGASNRIHQLKILTESLAGSGYEDSPFAMCRALRDAGDYDLYTWDQFRLIGNVGLATWDKESIRAKLVIGSFQFYDDGSSNDRKAQIQEHSGRRSPIATTYAGTQQLLSTPRKPLLDAIQKLTETLPHVEASIGFRFFFNRYQDKWINSRSRKLGDPGAWDELENGLRLAERPETVCHETVDVIRKHLADPDAENKLQEIEALLDASEKRTRRPTHHGVLVVSAVIDSKSLWAARSSLKQVQRVIRGTLDPLTEALRSISIATASPRS